MDASRFRSKLAAVTGLLLLVPFFGTAAAAATCADAMITARGEASSLEWLAKTKARANWRSRVRTMPKLGTTYSTWSRASQPDERCETSARGFVCTFTAIPCRP